MIKEQKESQDSEKPIEVPFIPTFYMILGWTKEDIEKLKQQGINVLSTVTKPC